VNFQEESYTLKVRVQNASGFRNSNKANLGLPVSQQTHFVENVFEPGNVGVA
jgi:hypothetical protein